MLKDLAVWLAFGVDFHTFYEAAHESFLFRISELIVQLIEIEQESVILAVIVNVLLYRWDSFRDITFKFHACFGVKYDCRLLIRRQHHSPFDFG